MRNLYLDCQFGISGDMLLCSLIDLGANIEYIRQGLNSLPIDAFSIETVKTSKRGISAREIMLTFLEEDKGKTHQIDQGFHHHSHEHGHNHEHRSASHIFQMIHTSTLADNVKKRALEIFETIAEAEGKIHGIEPEKVHFHEVGAMDSIIDIIGVCLALENLKIERILAAPVPTGYGTINIEHGTYPVPAPATLEMLKKVPISNFQREGEMTTPTGAAFLQTLVSEFGPVPEGRIDKIGYGAGKKDFEHPNILRSLLYTATSSEDEEDIIKMECHVDDTSGENLGYLMEQVLEKEALDVYFAPIQMKKNRPGTLITVLSHPQNVKKIEELILKETSTFGVRHIPIQRTILSRDWIKVNTELGDFNVKIGYKDNLIYQISPEYEEVKECARHKNLPLDNVYNSIRHATQLKLLETFPVS